MVPKREENPQTLEAAERFCDELLKCLDQDDKDRPKLTVTLPDIIAVETIARTLSQLIPDT